MMPSRPVSEKELALTTEEEMPSPELMSSTISDFQTHTDTHRLLMYTVTNWKTNFNLPEMLLLKLFQMLELKAAILLMHTKPQ